MSKGIPFRPCVKGIILPKHSKVRLTYTGEIFEVVEMDHNYMILVNENMKKLEYPTTFEITLI